MKHLAVGACKRCSMPSRLLREGILDSAAVNALSLAAEVFYRRLMSVVDDYGRFDGRPAVLRGRLYALKLDTVREADIIKWINECDKAGLIAMYIIDAKPYILFKKLGPARAHASKFPAPPSESPTPAAQHTDANGCKQVKTDVNNGLQVKSPVPYSYSGSDSDSDSSSGISPSEICSEPPKPAASEPPVLTFPTTGKGSREWHLTPDKLAEYEQSFPTLDVLAALRSARQWCIDNPTKRKTVRGMPRYCSSWLERAVNKKQHLRAAPALPFADSDGTPVDPIEAYKAKYADKPGDKA